LTQVHITDIKPRDPGDATAAPAPGDDNNDHEAKLSAYLPSSSLPLLESPVDDKARRTDTAAVAPAPGGNDDDNDDEAELSAYLSRSLLMLVGFPTFPQSCTSVALQTSTLTRLPTVDTTQRKTAKAIRSRLEQCVKRATEPRTLPKHRNDPNKTASNWNRAIQQLDTSPIICKMVLKFMRST